MRPRGTLGDAEEGRFLRSCLSTKCSRARGGILFPLPTAAAQRHGSLDGRQHAGDVAPPVLHDERDGRRVVAELAVVGAAQRRRPRAAAVPRRLLPAAQHRPRPGGGRGTPGGAGAGEVDATAKEEAAS